LCFASQCSHGEQKNEEEGRTEEVEGGLRRRGKYEEHTPELMGGNATTHGWKPRGGMIQL